MIRRCFIMIGIIGMLFGMTDCGTIMDGPGMVNVAHIEDFIGTWFNEDASVKLEIQNNSVSVYERNGSGRMELSSTDAAEITNDVFLSPAGDVEKFGIYSSIERGGRLLYATDVSTGEQEVFFQERRDLSPETLYEYNGVWLTHDQRSKLVIEDGKVTSYWKNENTGEYLELSTEQGEFCDRNGALQAKDGGDDLAGYSCILRKDRLLYATILVMDAHSIEEVFAREGHENDLPPPTIYAEKAEDVSDKSITSLYFHIGNDWRTDDFVLAALPDCEDAQNISLTVSTTRITGRKTLSVSVSNKDGVSLIERTAPFAPELEQQLSEYLLSPPVLEANPYRDSSDMMAPTVNFTLNARFGSGEQISIDTNYGIPIGNEAAGRIAALLING